MRISNIKKIVTVTGSVVLVVIAVVIIGIIVYSNSAPVKLSKQLELGQKYLTEQDYEQAIVAYQVAIEIDPMASDAYLGLADAYIGQGEYEKATEVLQTGYDITADERLRDKLAEVTAEIERIEAEKEAARLAAEKVAEEERVQLTLAELYELLEVGDDRMVVNYIYNNIANVEKGVITGSYSLTGDTENGIVLDVVHEGTCVYFGEKSNGSYETTGKWYYGLYYYEETGEVSYSKYDGEWKNKKPNGAGTHTNVMFGTYGLEDETYYGMSSVVTSGNFVDGYSHGEMQEYAYDDIYDTIADSVYDEIFGEWAWFHRDNYIEYRYSMEMGELIAGTDYYRYHFENGQTDDWQGTEDHGVLEYISTF